MSLTFDEISWHMFARRNADQALFQKMIETRDRYNADLVVPIYNAPDEPQFPQLAPQLIHDGIENTALRASMALPQCVVPALDPGKEQGKRSIEYAGKRRRALYAAWDFSLLPLLLSRAFRHLSGYGTFSAVVVPDFEFERARVELRDPLTAYPELRNPGDMRPPIDVGFVFGRSDGFLRKRYGSQMQAVGNHPDGDGIWDVVEWIDENDIVVGVLGPRALTSSTIMTINDSLPAKGVELKRWPNRAGMVPVAVPRRITLDRIAGQLEAATGAADWLDRLMALNTLAAEKNVFPDMYVIGEQNEEPSIDGGQWHDGRTGKINLVSGARSIGQLVSATGQQTQLAMSMLERAGRMSGGVIPQYSGEAPGSMRTGRAIETLGSFSVDPRIKELQDIMAAALSRSINPAIFGVEKGYWPDKKYVCFSGWPTDGGNVEYTPSLHFETTDNAVSYAFPGTDTNAISVALLQLVGGELISKKTARIKHPMIDDAESEGDQILLERLDDGLFASLLQQAASGVLPAIDAAQIRSNIRSGMSVDEAIIDADNKARERQSAQPAPPGPGQAVSPEMVPGLAQPGMGAEAPPPGIPPLPAAQTNLRDLLRAVRTK